MSMTAVSCLATAFGKGCGCYNGKWAFLNDHMDRLFGATKAIDLDIGMDRAGVIAALEATPAASQTRVLPGTGITKKALSTNVPTYPHQNRPRL